MKLGTALLRLVIVLALAAAAGQWWLVQRTQEEARQLIGRLVPYGELRYERLWPWPWGTGRVWNPSFRPEGVTRLLLRTPPGYRLEARSLEIHRVQLDADGQLQRVDGTLVGLRVPVNPVHAGPAGAADPADDPLPTLYDLGYEALAMDVDFAVEYVRSANLATVTLNASGPDSGRVFLRAQLEGAPETFARTPDQLVLRRTVLEYADAGLAARLKDVAAARSHLNRTEWEQAMIAHLDRVSASSQWQWDEASAQGVRKAIRESDYFRVVLDPPGDVVLRNMRLYPPARWPQLLGFAVGATGRFDHPPPGAPLP